MGCGILFPRDYRRDWDDIDDAAAAAVARDDAVNGAADVDAELGAGDAGFSSSESEDEQWWERPNPDNGTKVQVHTGCFYLLTAHVRSFASSLFIQLTAFMDVCFASNLILLTNIKYKS